MEELEKEGGGGLFGDVVGDGVGERAIFVGAGEAFGLGGIVVGEVVDFVEGVEAAEGFEGADLAATVGGVEEVSFDPEDFHLVTKLGPGSKMGGGFEECGFAVAEEGLTPELEV